jgi:hypothetical protein
LIILVATCILVWWIRRRRQRTVSKAVSNPDSESSGQVGDVRMEPELVGNDQAVKELPTMAVNEVDASVEIGTACSPTELQSDVTQRYEIYGRSISELDGTGTNKRASSK